MRSFHLAGLITVGCCAAAFDMVPAAQAEDAQPAEVGAVTQRFSGDIERKSGTIRFDYAWQRWRLPARNNTSLDGAFELRTLDANGHVVDTAKFDPVESSNDSGTISLFSVHVPFNRAACRAVVLKDGVIRGQIVGSEHEPVVHLLMPNGGEFLSGDGIVVDWTAMDVDGDALEYNIEVSVDGGVGWSLIATGATGTGWYNVALPQTNRGMVRVIASDGFRCAKDESDAAFSTPNNPPHVHLVEPQKNDVFNGEELVIVMARANDREDGRLVGTSLTWTSDRDGQVGTGEAWYRSAMTFSSGQHVLTCTATDSAGVQAHNSTNLTINR